MAVIPVSQIASYAYTAGFRSNSLTTAIAICLAESGGNTTATNHNTNGTTDYGLWQINSVHSQYNPTLLLSNPAYNAQAAWELSSHGINWQPWTTFNTGAYKQFLSQATAIVAGGTTPGPPVPTGLQGPWVPAYMKNLGSANYGMWNSPTPGLTLSGQVQPGEGGVDISVPVGTPVLALADGPVIASGFWRDNAHGVITQRVNVPGVGPEDLYYQHVQPDSFIKPGIQLLRGQHIATIGPFNEIEMGFNSLWGGVWGGNYADPKSHPGPWIRDPRPWLQALLNSSAPVSGGVSIAGLAGPYVPLTYTTLTSQVHNTLVNTPGFYGIALAVDEAEQFPGWVNLTEQTSSGLPDFIGIARSIGATISDNFTPFIIRSGLVTIGSGLLILLVVKPIQEGLEVVA